jgi:hypothetical protein
MDKKEKYSLIVLATISFLVYLFFLSKPMYILDGYIQDDMFYYLTVAKNFSNGKGIVYNDGNPTNGFHPLWFYILVIVYYFTNDLVLPIYIALYILTFFSIGTGIILYFIGNEIYDKKTGYIMCSFWLFNPYIIRLTLFGMETPIQAFFLSLLTYYLLKRKETINFSIKESFTIGILICFIFLSRLDGVFCFISVLIVLSVRKIKNIDENNKFKLLNITKIIKQKDLLIISILPSVIIISYMLWSYFTVGIFTPISGSVKSDKYGIGNDGYIQNIIKTMLVFSAIPNNLIFFTPYNINVQIFLFFLFYGIPILIILYFWLFKKDNTVIKKIKSFDFLIIFMVLFLGYYCFYQVSAWQWYAVFPCFLIVILYSIILSFIIGKIKKGKIPKNNVLRILKNNITVFILIIFIIDFSYNYYDIATHRRERYYYKMEMIEYIEENIPEDAKIGAFNTGFFQYYSKRDIINLDGYINSDSYNAHIKDNFINYLVDIELDYILDVEINVNELNSTNKLNITILKYFGWIPHPYKPSDKDMGRHLYLYKLKY